jgi:hypothetical protein
VSERLKKLFTYNFPECAVESYTSFEHRVKNGGVGCFDYYCLSGDLFEYFRPRMKSFENSFIPLEIESHFQFPELSGLKVGVSWKGGNNDFEYNSRSILLTHLKRLFTEADLSWINLQHGDVKTDIKEVNRKFDTSICVFEEASPAGDFEQYGALISGLDLVITIDNAVANFAGALGIPTFLMCSRNPFWWWRTSTDNKSLYFPSVTVFSQQTDEPNWDGLLSRLHNALVAFKDNK